MRGTSMLAIPLIALGIAIAPSGARAANLIQNGGFEDPTVGGGSYQTIGVGSGALPFWTIVGNPGNNVDLVQTAYSEDPPNGVSPFNAYEGLNSLDLTGNGNVGTAVGIQQSVATVVGRQYTLSFFVGRATPREGYTGFHAYDGDATVDLSLDGGVTRLSFTNSNSTPGQIDWQAFSHTFTAIDTTTLISFYNGTPLIPPANFAGLDDVRLEAVPEPASVAMLASGALGLAFLRFARRRAA
ncbi:DUF642 domain-containing protein [Paludisphaera sp.]|uniref:DUF642 domain-containing protein n=1 Tax=Paludisphaera sp. TaxID=2017432 RepID=UPI00301CD087